jgi:hypothetical protein
VYTYVHVVGALVGFVFCQGEAVSNLLSCFPSLTAGGAVCGCHPSSKVKQIIQTVHCTGEGIWRIYRSLCAVYGYLYCTYSRFPRIDLPIVVHSPRTLPYKLSKWTNRQPFHLSRSQICMQT